MFSIKQSLKNKQQLLQKQKQQQQQQLLQHQKRILEKHHHHQQLKQQQQQQLFLFSLSSFHGLNLIHFRSNIFKNISLFLLLNTNDDIAKFILQMTKQYRTIPTKNMTTLTQLLFSLEFLYNHCVTHPDILPFLQITLKEAFNREIEFSNKSVIMQKYVLLS